MIVAYIRVSTNQQNLDRQEYLAEEAEKTFREKKSAKDTDRPELNALLDYVREGDVVIVDSFNRLARSLKDLIEIVERLNTKGVELISKKENIDTRTPTGKLLFYLIAAIAQFERESILERQAEGIAAAKAKGKRLGRPHKKLDNFDEIYLLWFSHKISASAAAKKLGIARSSFYRRVGERDHQRV